MCLNKAKEILDIEYNKWYVEIEDSYQKDLMDEKIRHSYQVLGAGNFLLSHEDCFVNSSKLEIDKLKAIVLLHDVGRFYEYKVDRDTKRKGFFEHFTLKIGVVFMLLSAILLFVWYQII